MRISDWSSDVCSSYLALRRLLPYRRISGSCPTRRGPYRRQLRNRPEVLRSGRSASALDTVLLPSRHVRPRRCSCLRIALHFEAGILALESLARALGTGVGSDALVLGL